MILFLFDIDLTLISTGGAGLEALKKAFFYTYNIKDATDGINPQGKIDTNIFKEIFLKKIKKKPTKKEIKLISDKYLDLLQKEILNSTNYKILDGVKEFLDWAVKEKISSGLATGNLEKGARIKLSRADLNKYFPVGGFGSDANQRDKIVKIAIKRAEKYYNSKFNKIFLFGDTTYDIISAKNNSIIAVGILTGSQKKEDLFSCDADYVFKNFNEVLENKKIFYG